MAAGITYEPISSTTLGSAATIVTFSSITGSYTDLVLVCNLTVGSARSLSLRFNSDSSTNYSNLQLYGNGTSALSALNANTSYLYLAGAYTTLSTANISLQSYSNTTTYKTILAQQGNTGTETASNVALWRSTSAITSIEISAEGVTNNLSAGSVFTLYGIAAA